MAYFYSKVINLEIVLDELHQMDLSEGERAHLAGLLDSTIHLEIIDEILSCLSDDDKKLFLSKLHQDEESQELLEFLTTRVDNIEEKIQKVSQQLTEKLHEDIKEAKLRK